MPGCQHAWKLTPALRGLSHAKIHRLPLGGYFSGVYFLRTAKTLASAHDFQQTLTFSREVRCQSMTTENYRLYSVTNPPRLEHGVCVRVKTAFHFIFALIFSGIALAVFIAGYRGTFPRPIAVFSGLGTALFAVVFWRGWHVARSCRPWILYVTKSEVFFKINASPLLGEMAPTVLGIPSSQFRRAQARVQLRKRFEGSTEGSAWTTYRWVYLELDPAFDIGEVYALIENKQNDLGLKSEKIISLVNGKLCIVWSSPCYNLTPNMEQVLAGLQKSVKIGPCCEETITE